MGEKSDERATHFGRGSSDCGTVSVNYCSNGSRTHADALRERYFAGRRPLSYPLVKSDRRQGNCLKPFTQGSIESGFSDVAIDIHRCLNLEQGQKQELKGKANSVAGRTPINGVLPACGVVPSEQPDENSAGDTTKRASQRIDIETARPKIEPSGGDKSKSTFQTFHIFPRPFVDSVGHSGSNHILSNSKGRGSVCPANTKPANAATVNRPHATSERLLISNSTHEKEQTNALTSGHLHTNSIISERQIGVKRNFVDKETRTPRPHFHEKVDVAISSPNADTAPTGSDKLDAVVSGAGRVQLPENGSSRSHSPDCNRVDRTTHTGDISVTVTVSVETTGGRDLSPEMGNVIQRQRRNWENRSQFEEKGTEQRTANGERSIDLPINQATPDQSNGERSTATRAVPALVISDSSMDHEQQNTRYPDGTEMGESSNAFRGGETAEMGAVEKLPLKPHPSSDSAYSTDSNRPDGIADEAEAVVKESTYLAPSEDKRPLNQRGNSMSMSSSSSSSSSSPCHPPSSNDNAQGQPSTASESTLRVMSDLGSQRKLSSSSGSSFRSSFSFEESEDDMLSSDGESMLREHMAMKGRRPSKAQSSWTKIRRMVIWSPFMQSFKKKYPWVQLAGHAGNFQPGEEGCILKKYCAREADCLSQLSRDADLRPFAPEYHGVVDKDGEQYTRMQDLLLQFDCPSVMDCKMGIRTYLEDELVKAKIRPRLRHDMYKKMTEIAPDEPTPEEHEARAVTKPRYMQWREHVSSSSNLGFRIEGIKKGENEPSKDYKLTKTKEQVKNAFKYFLDDNVDVLETYMKRLNDVRTATEKSDFFMTHEVIGSSLLFVHDHSNIASAWMIDFGKTSQLPDNRRLTHREPWVEGNREDGYLYGLDNLISIFQEILNDLKAKPRVQNSNDGDDPQTEPRVQRSNDGDDLETKHRVQSLDDGDGEISAIATTRSATLQTDWTFSSQSSSESVEFLAAQDGIPDEAGDERTRKPPLRRQVATVNSVDCNHTENGDVAATHKTNDVTANNVTSGGDVIAQNCIANDSDDIVPTDFINTYSRVKDISQESTTSDT